MKLPCPIPPETYAGAHLSRSPRMSCPASSSVCLRSARYRCIYICVYTTAYMGIIYCSCIREMHLGKSELPLPQAALPVLCCNSGPFWLGGGRVVLRAVLFIAISALATAFHPFWRLRLSAFLGLVNFELPTPWSLQKLIFSPHFVTFFTFYSIALCVLFCALLSAPFVFIFKFANPLL